MTLALEPVLQETNYTCSAATLRAVLGYWGVRAAERQLNQLVGARPRIGAYAKQIAKAARKLGFHAEICRPGTLDWLAGVVRQGVPVIVEVESFNHPGQGHFVVVTGITQAGVEIMDPNVASGRRRLTLREFIPRWAMRGNSAVVIWP